MENQKTRNLDRISTLSNEEKKGVCMTMLYNKGFRGGVSFKYSVLQLLHLVKYLANGATIINLFDNGVIVASITTRFMLTNSFKVIVNKSY